MNINGDNLPLSWAENEKKKQNNSTTNTKPSNTHVRQSKDELQIPLFFSFVGHEMDGSEKENKITSL